MIPSLADKKITASLKQVANLHGIELLDHLIVSANKDFYSFADHGIVWIQKKGFKNSTFSTPATWF